MRVLPILLFLTFVVSPYKSWSAPDATTTLPTAPYSGEDDPTLLRVEPELRPPEPSFYLNVSLGFAGGNYLEHDEYQQGPFVAFRFIPLEKDSFVWDYQLEINKDNIVGLAIGRRWYCCPDDRFMPYVRASANMFLDSKDELAGFAEIRRWRLRSSVGIGQNFVSEFGVGLAVTGPDLFAQFGYNFGF